ncbi:MAG: MarR family winged helix-turn-helix transcriptional regulator [Hyphomicrobiales bacterium]
MARSPETPTPGFLVWRLAMKWRVAVDRALAPLGLTHAQYTLVASLFGMDRSGRHPSQRELADRVGLEPIYVSKLARALEAGGLLRRTEHPADTRAVQLALTERGKAVAVEAIAIVHDLLEQLTAPLGGASSERTRALTRELAVLLAAPPQGKDNEQ